MATRIVAVILFVFAPFAANADANHASRFQPEEASIAQLQAAMASGRLTSEALTRFYKILDRVNTTDRTAFVLRFMEGLELAEVATALGLSLATTKRRLARVWARVILLVERDPVLVEYGPKLVAPAPTPEDKP